MTGNMRHLNTNLSNYNIILGSKSPRRKSILEKIGLKFTIQKIDFDEKTDLSKSIEEVACSISKLKSKAFNNLKKQDILICADTVVSVENEIYTGQFGFHGRKTLELNKKLGIFG